MITYTNQEEKEILRRFLSRWRSPVNNLPEELSVHMAWSILLNHLGLRLADPYDFTFRHYNNNYAIKVLNLYRSR